MSGARSESRGLESLPMVLLVKIVCHLPHGQLKSVFHVSKTIRKVVQTAKQTHFNYTTPPRRSGRVSTPPAEHLYFPWEMMERVFFDAKPKYPASTKSSWATFSSQFLRSAPERTLVS